MIGRETFSALASARSLTKKLAMPRSPTVLGSQHNTKHVAFELLLHAAFVVDNFRGFMLEPGRIVTVLVSSPYRVT